MRPGTFYPLLLPHCCHIAATYWLACFSFRRRQRFVLAQVLVQYFSLPEAGTNIRPQPGSAHLHVFSDVLAQEVQYPEG